MAGGASERVEALQREVAELRSENANMFTLMEENAELRQQLDAARLRLETTLDVEEPDA